MTPGRHFRSPAAVDRHANTSSRRDSSRGRLHARASGLRRDPGMSAPREFTVTIEQ